MRIFSFPDKGLPALVPVLLFFASFWACDSPDTGGNTMAFRVNIGTEPPSLDWSVATDGVSFNVIGNLMVGLTEFDRGLRPAPSVAESWKILEGGRKIVFHLRDDVRWSDGEKVRARDFEYSWKRLLNPQTASEYAYILYDVVNAQAYNQGLIKDDRQVGVTATDDRTLEIKLNHPVSYFLALTTFEVTFPQRRDVVEKHGSRWTDPKNIVTNGPFLLDSWQHESHIELKANPNFFLGRPSIERVKMLMIKEKSTALAMYEGGQLDFLNNQSIPTLEKPRVSKLPGFRAVPQLRAYYYGFATDQKPFDDPRVRKAFSMAIDRRIFSKILHGGETAARCWIPPGMLGHNSEIGLPYNPPEARRLLREAGYPKGNGFPDVILGYNTDEDHKAIAEAVQGMWKRNLGVLVRLENQEWKLYLYRLNRDPPPIYRLGWGADYPDPDNFMKLFTSTSGNNHTRWKNPHYDRLVENAAGEMDEEKRKKLYDEAQRILCETDIPIMPLFTTQEFTALHPRFRGLELDSLGRLILRHLRPADSTASDNFSNDLDDAALRPS